MLNNKEFKQNLMLTECHQSERLKGAETGGCLLKASEELRCKNLIIITGEKEGEEEIKGKKIKFIPLWKWLLE